MISDSHPDIIVIGAGIVGICTAASLAEAGHKVIVIDERTVVFGSYNFSANAQDNNENCLIVDSPELAKLFVAEFTKVYDKAAAAR